MDAEELKKVTTKLAEDILKKRVQEMEVKLVEDLFYDLRMSNDPRAAVKMATAREMVSRFTAQFLRPMRDYSEAANDQRKDALKLLKESHEFHQAQKAEIQQLQSDLRAAREQTGIYESKKVAEAEAKAAAAELKISSLQDAVENRDNTIKGLFAELEGVRAKCAGLERDLSQVNTATAHLNMQRAADLNTIREHATAAIEKLGDRFGAKPGPFIDLVLADLNTVLALTTAGAPEVKA